MTDGAAWRIEIFDDLEAVHAIWDDLVAAMPDPGPFMLWDFAAIWWRHFGGTARLHLIVVFEGEQPRGLIPLTIDGRHGRWLAAPSADYVTPLFDPPESLPMILKLAADHLRSMTWATLDLGYLYPDRAHELITALAGVWYRIDDRMACPYIGVNGRSWADYWDAKPATRHKEMRKLRNRLAREKLNPQVKTITDPDRIVVLFPALAALHTRRQQSRSGHGSFRGAEGAFLREVSTTYAAKGRLTLGITYFNDQPAAYLFTFILDGATRFWRTSYDPFYRLYSPGKLLFFGALQDSFARGDWLIDFLQGLEPYKFQWTEALQPLVRPIFYRSRRRGWLDRSILSARVRLARIDGLHRLWVWVSHRLP